MHGLASWLQGDRAYSMRVIGMKKTTNSAFN